MNKKILIVDDDEGILDAISMALESTGYEVHVLARGTETIKTAKTYNPDLILLDMLMSGSDGRDICTNLKSDDDTRDIPVVMISAHPSAKAGAMESGADAFLAKPFELEDLLDLVDRFVNSGEEEL